MDYGSFGKASFQANSEIMNPADTQAAIPLSENDVRVYMKLKNEMLATKFIVDDLRKKALQLKENISTGKVQVAMATLDMGQRNCFERQVAETMANLKAE